MQDNAAAGIRRQRLQCRPQGVTSLGVHEAGGSGLGCTLEKGCLHVTPHGGPEIALLSELRRYNKEFPDAYGAKVADHSAKNNWARMTKHYIDWGRIHWVTVGSEIQMDSIIIPVADGCVPHGSIYFTGQKRVACFRAQNFLNVAGSVVGQGDASLARGQQNEVQLSAWLAAARPDSAK
jgi:hypothetical protein